MSEGTWIIHKGGKRPFKRDTMVRVQLRCRSRIEAEGQHAQEAGWWKRWTHDGGPGDIIAVRKA